MLFRTATGRVYTARSADQGATWSKPVATSLLNPNSKFATVTIDNQVGACELVDINPTCPCRRLSIFPPHMHNLSLQILIVHNYSATARTPLSLALSVDEGKTWEMLLAVETAAEANYSNPCIVEWSEDTVKVAYTVWGEGLKLATVKLATVEA